MRGVNCASLEWSNDGDGHILKTIEVAVKEWRADLIRLPLSQDRWFGKAPDQQDAGAGYRAMVRQVVDVCSSSNAYIILDLHWSDAGEWGKNIGQHDLPDQNSILFWKDLASVYRDDPAVLFDLYNEPSHIGWDQWFKGGPLTETDKKTKVTLTYESVGMPALLAAMRSTGAKNVVIVGGINWAYEVGGIIEGRELSDPTGNGVIYASHPYPHSYAGIGLETIAQWAARMEAFNRKFPLIVTEFGSIETDVGIPEGMELQRRKVGPGDDPRAGGASLELDCVGFPSHSVAVFDLRLELHAHAGVRRLGQTGAAEERGPVSLGQAARSTGPGSRAVST